MIWLTLGVALLYDSLYHMVCLNTPQARKQFILWITNYTLNIPGTKTLALLGS